MLDVPDDLRLQRVAVGLQQRLHPGGELGRPQHGEDLDGTAEIGGVVLDLGAHGSAKPLAACRQIAAISGSTGVIPPRSGENATRRQRGRTLDRSRHRVRDGGA